MVQSNEPNIEQKNACFAQFMGGNRVLHPDQKYFPEEHYGYVCHKGKWWNENNLQYHSSWEWLMPVVEKIESIENKRFGVCIDALDTMIMDYKVQEDEGERIVVQTDIYPDNGDTKISITHEAVYQFIQWLNQQKQTNEQ